jgi:hypothetical protein
VTPSYGPCRVTCHTRRVLVLVRPLSREERNACRDLLDTQARERLAELERQRGRTCGTRTRAGAGSA